ncbi:MAG: type II toxin-antitoxin system HicA family toxin [Candidatus Uhrbacteria bacterium]|nr:type II toxin-antitoxin system HicA family toxin [Candidatus Uhrbacteria bacterium]
MLRIVLIGHKRIACIFEKEGFVYQRIKGDHSIYSKSGVLRPIVIPMYDEVPVFIIKNLLRTAGIDRDRYFELLKQC